MKGTGFSPYIISNQEIWALAHEGIRCVRNEKKIEIINLPTSSPHKRKAADLSFAMSEGHG